MVTQYIFLICSIIISVIIGAIPTGFIVGKLKGIDIRKVGSGNIGATNTLRALGIKAGIIVLLIDVFKSYITLFVMNLLISKYFDLYIINKNIFVLIIGFAVIFGNTFNPFLKFKGGKGVATSLGVFLFLNPLIIFITLFLFLIVVSTTGFVSLGSILSVIFVFFLSFFIKPDLYFSIFTFFVAYIIIFKHRENIKRLIKKEENKISFKKK